MNKTYTDFESAQIDFWAARLEMLLTARRLRELERRSQSPHALLKLQAE